jgi:hypothetical protein
MAINYNDDPYNQGLGNLDIGNMQTAGAYDSPTEGEYGFNLIELDRLKDAGYDPEEVGNYKNREDVQNLIRSLEPTANANNIMTDAYVNYNTPELSSGIMKMLKKQQNYEPQYRIRDQLNRDFLQGGLFRDAKQGLGDTYDQLRQSPLGQGIGSIRNFATSMKDRGINLGKMALSGIGNIIMPGLGFVLSNLPKDSASNKFNRSFTVGGANMPNDPYGYYGALRAGNLNQDPFGRNPVSAFGNYMGTLAKDANYSGTNKFNLAKQDFAKNYFDKNAINAGGVKIDNTVYSGADYQGGGGGGGNMSASDFSDDTAGTPFRRGGIASL